MSELLARICTNPDDLEARLVYADQLTKSKLRRLVSLDLSSNKLTDDGLRTLAAWGPASPT